MRLYKEGSGSQTSGDLASFGLLDNLLDPALGDGDFSSADELLEYVTPDSGTDELLVLASQQVKLFQRTRLLT